MSKGAHLNDVRWSYRNQVVAARSNGLPVEYRWLCDDAAETIADALNTARPA